MLIVIAILLDEILHGLTEVKRLAVIRTFHTEIERDGKGLKRIERGTVCHIHVLEVLGELATMRVHVVKHRVAATLRILRIDLWIIG